MPGHLFRLDAEVAVATGLKYEETGQAMFEGTPLRRLDRPEEINPGIPDL